MTTELPDIPEVGRSLFHVKQLPLVEKYAALLATDGVIRGLIGPREVPRLWDRHILNCVVMADLLVTDSTLADIGSGAGLPGLVLAIARTDVRVTLIEPLLRRTTFLSEVVAELALENVEVVRGRADELHGKRTFDAVTSRALAPLPRLLTWSMPLVAQEGKLLALKGSNVADELQEVRDVLQLGRCAEPVIHTLGGSDGLSTTHVLQVAWAGPRSVDWPPTHRAAGSGARGRTSRQGSGRRR
ncbi:ribosomal RNA small subunit methyltransferase G [Nocardioides baekrokdamisoli]|uniref:Ribosomal RNA small subunit methyltransferase G n=1 Tax=Nocardioides baekrokdamisoli TaxID=1804624 RepID=A0A3G9IGS4_9ACTN|nr:16S rRNA (guanine(527)-N(7))-methyltransferase RsmG [Nocardioides baekrokdamisoli]BBH17392.1 ribosomal RNA small subunit methyltransferase G [Nocardioides baekrokdamisoli]